MLLKAADALWPTCVWDDHEESHIAPHDELKKCQEMLKMSDGLFVERAHEDLCARFR